MTESENRELMALRDRLHRMEARQRRRGRMMLVSIGAIAVFAFAIPVAFSAPPSPTPCSHGDLFCFGAGQPARAAEVNSNFETLHAITDSLTSNVNGRLSTSGGTVTGALTANAGLTVNGGLTVAGGLPISVSGLYTATVSGPTHVSATMTSTSRSVCFVQQLVSFPSSAAAPVCAITAMDGTWNLGTELPTGALTSVCTARCISW